MLIRSVAHDEGIEAVLGIELVAHAGRAQRGPQHAPAQIAARQRIVEHDRLVGAVKSADAQMDHAGLHLCAVVTGNGDIGVQSRKDRV